MPALLARTALAVALAALLLAPAVEAAQKPVAYFLKDVPDDIPDAPDPGPLPVPLPIGVPQLVLTGDAMLDPYDPVAANFPNGTRPHMRLVTPANGDVAPLEYLTPANHSHPGRVKGYLLVGLWPGPSAVANGNLSATLYEVPETGARLALANASIALDMNLSELPNATSLLPPNSTDPVAIAFYELAQVMPVLLQPAAYFLLGPVDLNVSNTSRLALDVRLVQGSSPAPLPVGASATLQYESIYTPSFVLVPWFTEDPPRTTTSKSSTSTSRAPGSTLSSSGSQTSGDDPAGDGKKEKSPGFGAPLLGAALVAAAFAARRRLR